MALGNIEKYSKIRSEQLSEEFYFQSLLQEAYYQAELSDSEMESLQMQCIKLLADKTELYNKGESSSVRIEVAQTLMLSNFYTIGLYLKSLPDTSSALDNLRKEPISKLYRQGRRIINTKLNVARHLYQLVCQTKIKSPNYTYNATIEEGIKIFFKQYNADYEAHETPASIDYQLMNPVTGLAGVEYMIRYLQNLYEENLFCSKFDAAIIHEVMCGYDEAYKNLLVNIFEQVLQNALGCTLLGKDLLSLNLVLSDIQKLKMTLKAETKESIFSILQRAADNIIESLSISNISLMKYIYASLPEFASRIHFAINNDTLQTIFVPRKSRTVDQVIKFFMGNKMDDGEYRNIVNEMLACRYLDDKIQIIKEHIKTLADFEDIIIDGGLSEAEALAVFNMLDDVEIVVLIKRHPHHREMDPLDFSEAAIQMQRYLEKYLQSIPKDRLKKLQKTVSAIEGI
ncbi:MAG: hypothetical protein A4E53_03895 [Pelotomaculum sp. PtaB.Bin104]|nr:MAG: hypothetical protein A4E53_03895 [Pelotomaculum sp. PtaB.Bin104]